MTQQLKLGLFVFLALLQTGAAQLQGWRHSGSLYTLTTPEGANLPASASEEGFPLLVRLNKGWFDFSQAKPNGDDLRFCTGNQPLAYQIWPNACGQGGNAHSDRLRDLQRRLTHLYSNLSVMPTLGFPSGQSCHFVLEDYEKMGLAMVPLLERDADGVVSKQSVTAPDLLSAAYAGDHNDEITLVFDQPVQWIDALAGQFWLDGEAGKIASGAATGNSLRLKLAAPSTAKSITYVVDKKWDPKTLLFGRNGIAALTFCGVPVLPAKPAK